MLEEMIQIHRTEAVVAGNFAAALDRVRQVWKLSSTPITSPSPAEPPRRKISECIAMLPTDSEATIDADFAGDVEAAIAAQREPLVPPAWD